MSKQKSPDEFPKSVIIAAHIIIAFATVVATVVVLAILDRFGIV